MAQVVITLRIMPEDPAVDLKKIENQATQKITQHGAEVGKVEIEPIAFGIKSINIFFIMDEKKGSTESLEQEISGIEGVNSVEVIDVRRAVG